jgi:peptidoglycan/LPS O-acetylase OafA/YrhL
VAYRAARERSRVIDKRIPSLDGLRAVSILLVVFGHGRGSFPFSVPKPIDVVITYANLGVSIFFVISGFLITSLLLKEQSQRGSISIRDFYIRRAFRIWPALYFFLAVIACVAIAGVVAVRPMELAAAGLYFWNYYPGGSTYFLGHTWSLAIEEQFYLAWPLLLSKCRRVRWIAIGGIVASPVIRLATYFLVPTVRAHIPIMFHTRWDMLMYGALAALLHKEPWFENLLRKCFGLRLHIAGAAFIFLISPQLAEVWKGAYLLPVGWTLEGAAITLMLLWAIQKRDALIWRLLNSRPLVHIGVISYSLYLWNVVFLASENKTALGKFPINIVLSFLAAELSYRFVEKPILNLRKRLAERPSRTSLAAEVPGTFTASA